MVDIIPTEPSFIGIPVSAIANIISAFATLIMAYLTWKIIVQSRRDYAVVKKQFLLNQAEKSPRLTVKKFTFKNNTAELCVKNVGKGDAHTLVFTTSFHLMETPSSTNLLKVKTEQGMKTYYPVKCINYFSKGRKEPLILKPGEETKIKIDPIFCIFQTDKLNYAGKTFQELIAILKNNKKTSAMMSFDLECTNAIEDKAVDIELASFVFDIRTHKNLERAIKTNNKATGNTLSFDAVETKVGWALYNFLGSKSNKNYISEEYSTGKLW